MKKAMILCVLAVLFGITHNAAAFVPPPPPPDSVGWTISRAEARKIRAKLEENKAYNISFEAREDGTLIKFSSDIDASWYNPHPGYIFTVPIDGFLPEKKGIDEKFRKMIQDILDPPPLPAK